MLRKLFGNREVKKHPSGSMLMVASGLFTGMKRNKEAFIQEGYKQNAVVYRAVNEITTAAACIEVELWQGDKQIEKHPALDVLKRPNPMQGYDVFIKNLFTDWLVTGEMFALRTPNSTELWPVSPTRVNIVEGSGGIPQAYEIGEGKDKKTYPVRQTNAMSDVFFHKFYNPANYWRGMSPLEAAAVAADANNAGLKWNYSLLKNSARPSGIVKFEGNPSDQTKASLTEYFKLRMQGHNNAGELPILEGGADWMQIDNSPRDMDFNTTLDKTDKYIAMVYGVPLPLISNEASTFNNMEAAKERLYTDTVIPLMEEFLSCFSMWFLSKFGEGLELKLNLDSVQALEGIRQKKYDRAKEMVNVGIFSRDEGRTMLGYEKRGGLADELFIPQTHIPISMSSYGLDTPEDTMKALGYTEAEIKEALNATT